MVQKYNFFFFQQKVLAGKCCFPKVGAHRGAEEGRAGPWPKTVCQDFSTDFWLPKRFDRKFRGEILKIERRKLQDFSPKFAVKLQEICKPLKFSDLQNLRKNGRFCQNFWQIFITFLSTNCGSSDIRFIASFSKLTKILSLGKVQINLAFLSFIRNFT